jgi:hypothetical protein
MNGPKRATTVSIALLAVLLVGANCNIAQALTASVTDDGFSYSAGWIAVDTTQTEHRSSAAGSTASINVTASAGGTRFSLQAVRNSTNRTISIQVDAGTPVNISESSTTATYGATVWTSPLLAAGGHTIRVRVVTPNGSITGARLDNGSFGGSGYTGDRSKETLAGLSLPSRGFFSGAAGPTSDKAATPAWQGFGQWRDSPIDSSSTWIDAADGAAWGWGTNASSNPGLTFPGPLHIAMGGPSNWATAASGAMDSQVLTALSNLRAARTQNGVVVPTFLTFAHELNGTWYPWSVSAGEVADMQSTLRRWEAIADTQFPEAVMSMGFNGDSIGGVTARTYLGDLASTGVIDVLDVHYYNQWPYIGTSRSGIFTSWEDGANRGTADNPRGILRWQQLGVNSGLPLIMSEWANNGDLQGSDQSGDDPLFINRMYDLINANAGKGPGQFLLENWFDINTEHNGWHLDAPGGVATEQPNVASAYDARFPMQ